MVIPEPTHNQDILVRYSRKFQLHNTNHARTREARNKVLELLAADYAINKLDAVLKIAELQNEIEEAELAIQEPFQIILNVDERSKHDAEWRSYWDRKGYLQKIEERPSQKSGAITRTF